MRTILTLLLLASLSATVLADQVTTPSELARLPPYCRGTQQIRAISQDPKPIEEYMAIYGKPYYHLHHYCWALNSENKSFAIRDKFLRESKLGYALEDIKYSLDRSDAGFVFLPEIYNSQARILFTLRRDPEAIIALRKAIEAKPDYMPAITRLSDYFVDIGDKTQAIKVLEDGIANSENASNLIKRLGKLGKVYDGIPGNARKKDDAVKDSSDTAPDTPDPKTMPTQSLPDTRTEAEKKANPYCRFCP